MIRLPQPRTEDDVSVAGRAVQLRTEFDRAFTVAVRRDAELMLDVLTFRIDGELYAVRLGDVAEMAARPAEHFEGHRRVRMDGPDGNTSPEAGQLIGMDVLLAAVRALNPGSPPPIGDPS